MSRSKKEEKGRKRASRLQCASAFAGLLITLGAMGVLAAAAFKTPLPAALTIRAEALRPSAGGWVVDVVVANHGDLTAAAVDIEGEVGGEKASASLDYVPGHGEKRASLVFAAKDRPEPVLNVLGWSQP